MTQKEKAVELFKKFYGMPNNSKTRIKNIEFDTAKKCALIAVDEIIKSNPTSELSNPFLGNRTYQNVNYWEKVKKEIEKI